MLDMYKPELLLPVGSYQMCLAAIHNGADAIYVGMPEFNARGRSHDHPWDELEEIIQTCHLYGVEVHLAFNILIFENEFEKAIKVLDKAMMYGPDALIVQDIGLISTIRKRYPNMVIHGSTQMTVTNHEAIEALSDLNINRFVLGRENSLSEIRQIKNNTDKELEVFVHGALCVAYSGQCFTSESLGGRSANRGQCAQSCRFDYELYVDGSKKNLGINKYLVSPQDLCGIDEIPELMDIGIKSFKVEGRLKSSEFVGTVAKSYKSKISKGSIETKHLKEDMAVTYSRGQSTGWLHGVAHQELVEGSFKENRGALIGSVSEISGKEVVVQTNSELSKGDGLLFVGTSKNKVKELGERIYHLKAKKNLRYIVLGPRLNLNELSIGDKVYLTRRESVIKEVSLSISDKHKNKKVPITMEVQGAPGENLSCLVDDGKFKFKVSSEVNLEAALKRSLSTEELRSGLCGMSHTAFVVDKFINNIGGNCFLHNRELKKVKQNVIKILSTLRTEVKFQSPVESNDTSKESGLSNTNIEKNDGGARLNVLIRKKEQLDGIISICNERLDWASFLNYIILDYEFGKDYFSSIKILKEHNIPSCIATTRVLKPNEYHNFKLIERCEPDAILIRNLGALHYFKGKPFELFGDFSLNSANSRTHNYLIKKGLNSQCMSYDLNINQVNNVVKNVEPSQVEITIHQYMPEFHMEHCVFAAFMSKGNSFRDCGKPCEKHEVFLKDMYGNRHEIKADQECRNTMFNGKAQSTIKYFQDWKKLGVGFFRFECLHENGDALKEKLSTYFDLLADKIGTEEAFKKIGKSESYGLISGQISKSKTYKSRKS